jgi:hypothetical protein
LIFVHPEQVAELIHITVQFGSGECLSAGWADRDDWRWNIRGRQPVEGEDAKPDGGGVHRESLAVTPNLNAGCRR